MVSCNYFYSLINIRLHIRVAFQKTNNDNNNTK